MTVVIKKHANEKAVSAAKRKLKRKQKQPAGLLRFFGALKRGLDGVAYQNQVRNEWN